MLNKRDHPVVLPSLRGTRAQTEYLPQEAPWEMLNRNTHPRALVRALAGHLHTLGTRQSTAGHLHTLGTRRGTCRAPAYPLPRAQARIQ